MKKPLKIFIFLLVAVIIIGVAAFYGSFKSQQTFYPSFETGVVVQSDKSFSSVFENAPIVQQTGFFTGSLFASQGASSCPTGTTSYYCAQLDPSAKFRCSVANGRTYRVQCGPGELCNNGQCLPPPCPSGTENYYCAQLDPTARFRCDDGYTYRYSCGSGKTCSNGQCVSTTVQQACPPGRENYYCSQVDPSSKYRCKPSDGKTYKYSCGEGRTCSNGQCVSTSAAAGSSQSCPDETVAGQVSLPDTAAQYANVAQITCEKINKYTQSGNTCIEEAYCKSYTTTCNPGFVIQGTSDQSATGLKDCELDIVEVPAPVGSELQTISSACTQDVTVTCDGGQTIIVKSCEGGVYIDTQNTCVTESSPTTVGASGSVSSGGGGGSSSSGLQLPSQLAQAGQNSYDNVNYTYLYISIGIGAIVISVFGYRLFKRRRR